MFESKSDRNLEYNVTWLRVKVKRFKPVSAWQCVCAPSEVHEDWINKSSSHALKSTGKRGESHFGQNLGWDAQKCMYMW